MNVRQILLVLAIIAFGTTAAHAAPPDELKVGLKTGATIPTAIAAPDQTGKLRDFASLTGKKGLILLFTRSLDW